MEEHLPFVMVQAGVSENYLIRPIFSTLLQWFAPEWHETSLKGMGIWKQNGAQTWQALSTRGDLHDKKSVQWTGCQLYGVDLSLQSLGLTTHGNSYGIL